MRASIVLLMLLTPAVANAQAARAARVRFSINFGTEQPAATTFTATTTKSVYQETATITTAYATARGTYFDGGALIRVKGGFAVGAALSASSHSDAASVTGAIPHPFFFGTPRAISGTTSPLERSYTAVHVQAAYVISSKRVDAAIAVGPTFFNVSQELAADATYTEAYPFDTAAFSAVSVSKVSASKMGFNAGVDVGVKLSRNVGVGGLIRFSRASVNFPLPNTASGVTTDVGGVQAGGGVRFWF